MAKEIFLSTWDNPYNPYTQEEQWRRHDEFFGDSMKYYGINCPSMQARYAYTSDDLSEADNDIAIEEGIDEIIKLDPFGIYRKVIIEVDDSEEPDENDE